MAKLTKEQQAFLLRRVRDTKKQHEQTIDETHRSWGWHPSAEQLPKWAKVAQKKIEALQKQLETFYEEHDRQARATRLTLRTQLDAKALEVEQAIAFPDGTDAQMQRLLDAVEQFAAMTF